MEDAMIINKSSLERGFAHGSIYKCDLIELKVCYGTICSNRFGRNIFNLILNAFCSLTLISNVIQPNQIWLIS